MGQRHIRQGLDMPDQSIDLIHGCFLSAGLRIQAWPALLRECKRVLRPGGIVSLIEGERIGTNQPILACFFDLLAQARHQAGQIIENSESGWSLGEHIEAWLHEIGCQDIQRRTSMLDLSPDPNDQTALFPPLDQALFLLRPFLEAQEIIENDLWDALREGKRDEIEDRTTACRLHWHLSSLQARFP